MPLGSALAPKRKRSAECPDPCVSKGHAQKISHVLYLNSYKIYVLLLVMIATGITGFVSCKKEQKEVAIPSLDINSESGLRLSYRDGLVPNLDNVHRVTCMQLYNNIDSIPTWSLNPNGVYQEQALSRNTIYQSPSWVVNILRKDRGTSVYLYTILKPGGCNPFIHRCCRRCILGDGCYRSGTGLYNNCCCLLSRDCGHDTYDPIIRINAL
ncbi:MAG: hypothetical protein NZ519_13700 [Bacteroidia bacterium]|nr:hypothetical protein [Bacteroidia bacterium]